MANRRIAAPSCPLNHLNTRIRSYGVRHTGKGLVRRWRCEPRDGAGDPHVFTVVVEPTTEVRVVLDDVIAPPSCPLGHEGTKVIRRGSYKTAAGLRQRYLCESPDGTFHRFTAVLPRAQVAVDVHCDDCGLPTPSNSGSEATARRNTFPMRVVFQTLRDLSEGRSYAAASLWALEASGKPRGRSRKAAASSGEDSPDRDAKAHWHVAVDIMEEFAPFITERAIAGIAEEESGFRERGLPIIYTADQSDVFRNYIRSKHLKTSAQVWSSLVLTRVRWEAGPRGRSNRLLRVRALPSGTQAAWELVLSEVDAPDFLICDGATAISNAAAVVWGGKTVIVPCLYHAMRNIERAITPRKQKLPEKVSDHLFSLSSDFLAEQGPSSIPGWFDELEQVMAAEELPLQALWKIRPTYESLLQRTATVAVEHQKPFVPLSNAGAEALIQSHVSKLTDRRGPMFTNLPRTNLLGDLMVAGTNGYLNDEHALAVAIRASNRDAGGWAPPPRALNEPLGAKSLRNPRVIRELRSAAGVQS